MSFVQQFRTADPKGYRPTLPANGNQILPTNGAIIDPSPNKQTGTWQQLPPTAWQQLPAVGLIMDLFKKNFNWQAKSILGLHFSVAAEYHNEIELTLTREEVGMHNPQRARGVRCSKVLLEDAK
jgi:hypothetical protein